MPRKKLAWYDGDKADHEAMERNGYGKHGYGGYGVRYKCDECGSCFALNSEVRYLRDIIKDFEEREDKAKRRKLLKAKRARRVLSDRSQDAVAGIVDGAAADALASALFGMEEAKAEYVPGEQALAEIEKIVAESDVMVKMAEGLQWPDGPNKKGRNWKSPASKARGLAGMSRRLAAKKGRKVPLRAMPDFTKPLNPRRPKMLGGL